MNIRVYRISFRDKYRREIKSMEIEAVLPDIAFAMAREIARSIKGCTSMAAMPIREAVTYVN